MGKRAGPQSPVEAAREDLERALRIMSTDGRYQPGEWLLLATLVGEADLVVRALPHDDAAPLRPLLDRAVTELHELTLGFTRLDYLRGSRAARRRNPTLLNPR